ncbi:alkaline phosphatase family protein [Flagellimonas algicola]|uniref:Alkaline phosphatase family protein n=2 Tax=Flagellimonas algicola TaxID=2583815 RepID=A0ABY2WM90_9FLAO|nr:alkaline phosphatase family protein [Allomuricauda algicola]
MALIKANNMKIGIYTVIMFFTQLALAQQQAKPKLVVGIVVDQMRAEYLYRFQDNYGANGFKRLMREGFNVKNMHYNYVPTATGPGHASIYTGTTPANHGIVANDWYDKTAKRNMYCAQDEGVFLTDGTSNAKKEISRYSRSPKNLLASTITDELKLFTNGRSKVIGISLKDRGAIFPAGHLANHAFWYHEQTGKFITSSYYSEKLPYWLMEFNKRQLADSLLNLTWNLLKPSEMYQNSGADDASMEKVFKGRTDATLPYNLKRLHKANGNFAMMPYVPFGNSLLTALAKAAMDGEKLGQRREIDFMAISYSSTDYIGHSYGIRSKELEDTYLRMDEEIANLLSFFDSRLGKGNYLVFLTADHAASDHPDFLKTSNLPGDYFGVESIKEQLNKELSKLFGEENYVAYMDKTQIYLNGVKTPKKEVLKASMNFLSKMEGIKELYVPEFHSNRNWDMDTVFRKSYHSDNSGDILLHFKSGWMPKRMAGTTHGAFYNNDKHVPCLWFGWNVPKGETVRAKSIDQIAPTLSMLLNIPFPSHASNKPIGELFR